MPLSTAGKAGASKYRPPVTLITAMVSATGSNSIVITKPAGIVDGDLLLVRAMYLNSKDSTDYTMSGPGSWTKHITGGRQGSGIGTSRTALFYKVASGEGATWGFTTNAAAGGSIWSYGDLLCLRNAVIDGAGTLYEPSYSSSGAATVVPGLTASTIGTWHIGWNHALGADSNYTQPANYTLLADNYYSSMTFNFAATYRKISGTIADQNALWSASLSFHHGMAVAVKPSI